MHENELMTDVEIAQFKIYLTQQFSSVGQIIECSEDENHYYKWDDIFQEYRDPTITYDAFYITLNTYDLHRVMCIAESIHPHFTIHKHKGSGDEITLYFKVGGFTREVKNNRKRLKRKKQLTEEESILLRHDRRSW